VTSDRTTVLIYCTECGNRSSRNVDTGEEHDTVLRVTAEQLATIQADLPIMKCVYCQGKMALMVLDDDE
jgi:hypothetical protein